LTIWRFLQTAGNPLLASQMLEKAREMDLADRYLNTKSVRFLLRADKIQEAEKTISPFAKLVCLFSFSPLCHVIFFQFDCSLFVISNN
jgi:hypothetical protein